MIFFKLPWPFSLSLPLLLLLLLFILSLWLNAQWWKFSPQPLWQSGWVAAPATECLSARVAGEWLLQLLWQSGWVAAVAPLSHSARVAEWLLQPLCQSGLSAWVPEWLESGCSSHAVAEWLLQPLWQSGWVGEWLLQPLWQSGWVAVAESSANEMDKVFQHFNIQARLYYMILTATWFTNITL